MLTRTRLGAVPAAVTQVRTLSPHMTRVTLHANDFADLTYRGSDHYVRLLLPRASQVEPLLPSSAQWWPEMVAMPAEVRPILRNYTVADLRPAAAEMDIDFVCHGDTGPATRWVNRAQVGSPVGIIDQGVLHDIRDDAHEYLIVGDETALPAATGLLGVLPAGITTTVLLEVPTEADRRELAAPGASINYHCRQDPHGKPGVLLVDAVRNWRPSTGRVVAWVSGESSMTTAVRRLLVKAGVAKADISFHGYFKFGQAQYDD